MMMEVITEVAEENGIKPRDIIAKKWSRRYSQPRQDAMLAARDMGFSFPMIGKVFKRDHTTVMDGVKVALKREARQ